MYQSPFLGVFSTKDGELFDIASNAIITPDKIKVPMSPFYGIFLDKDGIEHDLRDYLGGGGGGGIPEAPEDGKQYARQNKDWNEVELGRQFNWRGKFQLGNMYFTNDVVLGDDGNDYIAVSDGLVLPPPSPGWDEFLLSGGMSIDVYDPQRRETDIFAYVDDTVGVLNDMLAARLAGE